VRPVSDRSLAASSPTCSSRTSSSRKLWPGFSRRAQGVPPNASILALRREKQAGAFTVPQPRDFALRLSDRSLAASSPTCSIRTSSSELAGLGVIKRLFAVINYPSSALGALFLLFLAFPSFAASRARYGGTLKIATAVKATETDPLLADTPLVATLVSLLHRPLCRIERSGAVTPVLASELSRPSPTSVRALLRPGLARASGSDLASAELASHLTRIAGSLSPYRALLAPLKSASGSELTLAFPFPDFERALCHPALAPSGVGPYRFANQTFTANVFFPEGRPFTDALTVSTHDARGAARLLQQRKAHLAFGLSTAADDSALLYSTFLAFNPGKTGPDFRAAFESAIERAELTRLWVLPPAAPMPQLLPPPLALGMTESTRPTAPAPLSTARELTLAYDAASPDHRPIAELLQVKLHASGYRIALKPISRVQLRNNSGAFDLVLHSVLVPPTPSLALALALELGGRHDQLPLHLTALGAITDDKARARAAQVLAEKLWRELPLIPLYAQALGIQAARDVQNLKTDAQGLPLLDSIFLGQD
jgi:peptide/nickel transport system substrate-binding protein